MAPLLSACASAPAVESLEQDASGVTTSAKPEGRLAWRAVVAGAATTSSRLSPDGVVVVATGPEFGEKPGSRLVSLRRWDHLGVSEASTEQMNGGPEEALVSAAQDGSQDAVAVLFERHWRDAWRLAFAITGSSTHADDSAQEAFVRAIERIRRLRDPARFRPWLHRIVVTEALGDRRRRRREVLVEQAPDTGVPQVSESGPALEALAQLSPERRAAVALRHCLEYSLQETAGILGIPVGTVQSRAARGLAEMRALMEIHDGQ